MKHNGVWGTVCDDSFDTVDGRVICKTLGFQMAVSTFTAPPGKKCHVSYTIYHHYYCILLNITQKTCAACCSWKFLVRLLTVKVRRNKLTTLITQGDIKCPVSATLDFTVKLNYYNNIFGVSSNEINIKPP